MEDKKDEIKTVSKPANDITNTILSNKELVDSFNGMLSKASDIAGKAAKIKEIQAETILKSKKMSIEHEQVMTNMEKHYRQQDKALDISDKVIDEGLNSGNIEMVKVGLTGMLGTIGNKFKSDKISEIESRIRVDDEEDDIEGI